VSPDPENHEHGNHDVPVAEEKRKTLETSHLKQSIAIKD
jgi:hypothetical protein